eukprot:m.68810 g.68810  ORF g.68810 m.68810 type:complete len:726 (-) comp23999_c0_seq1:42-2219(-)
MPPPQPSRDEVDSFMGKIDQITALITDIKDSKSGEASKQALANADDYIEKLTEEDGKITSDRTVINKSISTAPPPPQTQTPHTTTPSSNLPDGCTPDQAAFMHTIEQDAAERRVRRLKREADSLIPKEKGNEAFKSGDYETAVRFYLEATDIDPSNSTFYSNCAQAYIKLGKFEKAAERSDWAVRADEKNVKGHLRYGLAKCALGDYDVAIASFKTAKVLTPKDKQGVFNRHIEDAVLAKEIASREKEVETSGGFSSDNKCRLIELDCAKLSLSSVNVGDALELCVKLTQAITEQHHQDLFRLRKGTRVLLSPQFQSFVEELTSSNHVPAAYTQNTLTIVACCNMLVVAVKDNEASRRSVIASDTDVMKMGAMLGVGVPEVQCSVMQLLLELACSTRVRETMVKHTNKSFLESISKLITTKGVTVVVQVSALKLTTEIAKSSTFSSGIRAVFLSDLYPRLCELLDGRGTCAAAVLLLMQLTSDAGVRKMLSEPSGITPLQTTLPKIVARVRDGSENASVLSNFLGLLTNVALEPAAATKFQEKPFTTNLIKLLILPEIVTGRVITLVCRLCTTTKYIESLLSLKLLDKFVDLTMVDAELQHEFDEVLARVAIKCVLLSEAATEFLEKRKFARKMASLLHGDDNKAIGNFALCIAELCKKKEVCADLVDTTVIADLLLYARKNDSKSGGNCVIALARLSVGHQDHLARLKQLDGLEVLHSRRNNTK